MADDNTVEQISVDLVAQTGNFVGDINKAVDSGVQTVGKGMEEASKKSGGLVGAIGGVVGSLGKIGLAGLGIQTVIGGFKSMAATVNGFFAGAIEREASVKRLAAAVDASGASWAKEGKEINKQLNERKKLAFSSNELRSSLAMLVAQTGDHQEALKRQRIAMDFARGAKIDLSTASRLLGRVTDETTGVLGRYGITVKEGATATDVLALVQKKFSGQSKTYAKTASGQWKIFSQQMGALKGIFAVELLPVFTAVARLLASAATWATPQVQALVDLLKQALTPTILEVVDAVEKLVLQFKDLATPILGEVIDKVVELLAKLKEFAEPIVASAIETAKEKFKDFVDTLETIRQSSTFKAFLDGIEEGFKNIGEVALATKDILVDAFAELDRLIRAVPGFAKFVDLGSIKPVGLGGASQNVPTPEEAAALEREAEAARNVGKLFTEAAAGILAFSIATSLLDTSINIIGNSLSGLGAMVTGIAAATVGGVLAFLAVAAVVVLVVGALYLLETETGIISDALRALEKFGKAKVIPFLKDVGKTIEKDVIPWLEEAAKTFKEEWMPVIEEIAEGVGKKLLDALDTLADGWTNIYLAIKPVLPYLEDAAVWFSKNEKAIQLVVAVLAGLAIGLLVITNPWILLVAALVLVLAYWDDISKFFKDLGKAVADFVTDSIAFVKEFPIIGEIIQDTFRLAYGWVKFHLDLILIAIKLALDLIVNFFQFWKAIFSGDWSEAWQQLKDSAALIWNAMKDVFGAALDLIKGVFDSKLTMLKGIGTDMGNAIAGAFETAFGAAVTAAKKIISQLIKAYNAIPFLGNVDDPFSEGNEGTPTNTPTPSGNSGPGSLVQGIFEQQPGFGGQQRVAGGVALEGAMTKNTSAVGEVASVTQTSMGAVVQAVLAVQKEVFLVRQVNLNYIGLRLDSIFALITSIAIGRTSDWLTIQQSVLEIWNANGGRVVAANPGNFNLTPAGVPAGTAAGSFTNRSLTNYGRITNVYGPGRKSIDVIRDLDRMV